MSKPEWKVPRFEPNAADGETREQFDNMIAGQPYKAGDKYVARVRDSIVPLLAAANAELDMKKRMELFSQFIVFRGGERNSGPYICQPFTCEYGFNISMGDDSFFGPNCTALDVCPSGCYSATALIAVRIGDRTMIAANTQLYTPSHPIL